MRFLTRESGLVLDSTEASGEEWVECDEWLECEEGPVSGPGGRSGDTWSSCGRASVIE